MNVHALEIGTRTRADARRVFAFILATAMLLSMVALPAMAEPHDGEGGNCYDSIEIDGETYDGTKLDGDPRGEFELEDGVSIVVTDRTVTAEGGDVILCVKGGPTNSGTIVLEDGETYIYPNHDISNIVWYLVEPTVVLESTINVSKTADGSWDRTITWELDKTVDPDSHTGGPGDVFTSDWTVTATKTEVEDNYEVSGEIDITYVNNSSEAVSFTVEDVLDDGTVADVTCPSLTMPAETADVITCTYTASPDDADAETNTATLVLPETLPEDFILDEELSELSDTEDITWTENTIGDDVVDLIDDEGPLDEELTDSAEFIYEGTFECPTDLGEYDADGQYTETIENIATLTGDEGTDLEATAEVTITCALVFVGETVTGAGDNWSDVGPQRGPGSTNTWFQYTVTLDAEDDTFDLVQGRHLTTVGSVQIVDNVDEFGDPDGTTTLHFTFDSPWQLEAVDGNVKIEPLEAAPTAYIAPGQYSYHFTKPSEFDETSSDFSVTVSTASYGYAIHLDAGYWDIP